MGGRCLGCRARGFVSGVEWAWFRQVAAILGALALGAGTLPRADAQTRSERKVAFVVGVGKYQKDGLRDLHYAESDARDLVQELRKQEFQVDLLVGDQASLAALQAALEKFY